ncbi:MAG: glycosyltransferase family 4 protein [Acidobacteria bacterium]|nr:glycosyltransferase family 4 protein [Acidobacteriota bacterium]
MRIAFCQPDLTALRDVMRGESTEAACIQQGYIAAGLSARGHQLTFVAPRGLDEVECASDLDRVTTVPRTWSAGAWFETASRSAWRVQRRVGVPYLNVFSTLRRFDACLRCLPGHDVVHERNGLYNAGVAMACRRLGLPFVLFFDADQIAEHDFMGRPVTGLLRWRARQLLRYNLRTARCVICVSDPARAGLLDRWRVPPEKVVVLPNGVDTERFQPAPDLQPVVRAELGVEPGPVVIFVGNFYEWHDIDTLLDAFAGVLRALPGARLLLVGDGPTRDAMQRRASALGLDGATRFVGAVPHAAVPRLIAAADVAVAPVPPMSCESWLSPMKLFEYMASGVAIVATRAGQLAAVVQDDGNGLLVPPGDAPAMGAAIIRLLEDPALRARLGTQARQEAVEQHSWDRYVTRLERLYTAVVTGRSPAGG